MVRINMKKKNLTSLTSLTHLDGTCTGVCVTDHIAEYCEAYFTTSGLCKSGSKCCVPLDAYKDKLPAELHIPNPQIIKNHTQSKPTKTMISTTSSQRPKPMHQSPSRPQRPQEPSRESLETNQIDQRRPCDGECVAGLFALFCDELDNEAFCPNEGSCCITADENTKVTTPKPHVTVSIQFDAYKIFN